MSYSGEVNLATNTKAAVDFLKSLRPKGPWTLAAIDPENPGPPTCRTFIGDYEIPDMQRWIETRNGKSNLYFTINPTKRPTSRKPLEADISHFQYAHADCDPRDGELAADAKTRHRAKLKSGAVPLPTFIYDSGNGVVALWRMRESVPLKNKADVESCKATNIGIIQALGGKVEGYDACQNLDRLLRLPGTLNIPDERKRAKGRKVELAGNVEHNPEARYSVFDFPAAGSSPSIAPSAPEIAAPEYVDLDELKTDYRIKEIIRDGRVAGETKEGDDSRSAWEFEAICGLIRDGVSDGVILGVLLNPEYEIGERVRKRANPEEYARKEIARAHERLLKTLAADFAEPLDTAACDDDASEFEEPKKLVITPTPYEWKPLNEIARREWLLRPAYAPGFVSLTVAAGGVGKSKLVMVEACAIASGKPLLGTTPERRVPVWYFNGEDPQEEIERNIGAIRLHYELEEADVAGWLFTDSGRDTPLKIATLRRGEFKIAVPVVDALIEAIRAHKIGAFIVDPFVTTHTADENDNPQMNAVVDKWRDIADATGCVVHLVHHMRKNNGEVANIESARGASALKDAARVRRAVNQMTAAQAKAAGISEDDRRRYISADYGQSSLIPAGGPVAWHRFESVTLPNGPCGDGDDVGVVVAADLTFSLRPGDEEAALEAVRAGGAHRWRKRAQAGENWVGRPISFALGLNPDDTNHRRKISETVEAWLQSGLLREVEGKDKFRNAGTFITAEDVDFG